MGITPTNNLSLIYLILQKKIKHNDWNHHATHTAKQKPIFSHNIMELKTGLYAQLTLINMQ